MVIIANRVFYYLAGDEARLSDAAPNPASQMLSSAATQLLGKEGLQAQAGALAGQGRAYMEA